MIDGWMDDNDNPCVCVALTVVTRIYYALDTRNGGTLTLKDVKKSNLVAILLQLDETADVRVLIIVGLCHVEG